MRDYSPLTFLQVGNDKWSITQGFYAVMGGLAVDWSSAKGSTSKPFTDGTTRMSLTPKGILLLAKCGRLPEVSEREILDKSKVDEIGKVLACMQVTWMIVQVCARLGLDLPVTTLEVTAVSHVVCALVLYALWWYKPRKVEEPTVISGDWVKPLAAFMLMCSRESERQMLPGYHLQGEGSEIAGLKLEAKDTEQYLFEFVWKTEPSTKRQHERPFSRSVSSDSPDAGQPLQTPEDSNDKVFLEIANERWQLAKIAIRDYPAVRELLQPPVSDKHRKLANALATYPEMPEKCREARGVEEAPTENAGWLECNTQHLVATVASNWPHDGLLRTTSGLWIGASLWLVSFVYSGIHIAAWNAAFPSELEAWLWRFSSLYIAFSGLLWAGIHILAHFSAKIWWAWYDVMSGEASRPMTVPLTVVCSVCGLAYIFSRVFLIVEALISLRYLPVAAYVVPEWTLGVPHVA